MKNDMQNKRFEVYLPQDGEFRAFFSLRGLRKTRTVVLPVSTHRMALRLAARLFDAFEKAEAVSIKVVKGASAPLWKYLYEYIGVLLDQRSREWATVRGYQRNLKDLFLECGWKRFADITAESFLAWRVSSARSPYQHNRFLREANAFFDEQTVIGRLQGNPLRKISPLPQQVADSRPLAGPERIAEIEKSDPLVSGNDLKLYVGGSTEKAASPSQGLGILNGSEEFAAAPNRNACAAACLVRST